MDPKEKKKFTDSAKKIMAQSLKFTDDFLKNTPGTEHIQPFVPRIWDEARKAVQTGNMAELEKIKNELKEIQNGHNASDH